MAVPKKKTSRSRKNMRRSHDHVVIPNVNYCTCGAPVLRHCICDACGTYKGKQVIEVANA